MKVIKDVTGIKEYCANPAGPIGLVPTMGAIHEGHLALVRRARMESALVVVSIFVNPLQFENQESSDHYPRPFEEDLRLLAEAQADVVFCPQPVDLYPPDFSSSVSVSGPANPLEGEARPGHFKGVTTVMAKLMNLISPDIIFLGQKDYQQIAVIKRLAIDLNWLVSIRIVPTVRDEHGLALSSRNVFLKPIERKASAVLFRALIETWHLYHNGNRDIGELEEACWKVLVSEPLVARIDYVALVDPRTFLPPRDIDTDSILVIAVWIGETRLIDNIVLSDSDNSLMDLE